MGMFRKLWITGVVIVGLLISAFFAVLLGVNELELPEDCPTAVTSESRLTVKGEAISQEQMDNAVVIVSQAIESDLTVRDAESGIEGAIQESVLGEELDSSTSSSAGLFHQIDDWAPLKVRMDPEQAAYMFFNGGQNGQRGLKDIEGRETMTRGEAVQAVQGSRYPDAYDKWESEAIAIVASILGDEGEQSCEDDEDLIELMVQAALSRVGGPLSAIESGGETFRVATFNVLGSNHTSGESAMNRIADSVQLIRDQSIAVAGLQELRPDQRRRLLELVGSDYAIYPDTPVYGESQLAVNSIIWDTSVFELVDARPTPMPYYFGGQKQDIPLVELRHKASGTVITVVNTHDPAKPKNARLRYLDAMAHAELVDTLTAQGAKVFFTGDFNSGFALRSKNNVTYLNDRANLTWCIMTKSGAIVNGYDDLRGRSGCPSSTSDEMGVGPVDHVFVPTDGVSTVDFAVVDAKSASDHPLVYAEVSFDGTEPKAIRTSAQFVSWAGRQAGLTLPSTFKELANFEGSEEDGLTGRIISAADIAAGEPLERGDLVAMKGGTIGIYTGSAVAGSTFRVATWNIKVGEGYQARVDRAHQLIKQYGLQIIGFQEVENKAMFDALASSSGLGSGYAIYPENPKVVAHGWIGARPIVYDSTRFEKIDGGSFSFPRMHLHRPEKQPVDFPWLRLRDRVTGQDVVVMNVHFAAFKRYAKERYESGLSTVEFVKQQVADGTAVVLTGDFNGGFYPRMDSPNPTYHGLRENLAYCQFTKNGLMNNAVDLAETDDRFAPGSYCPRTQADGGHTVDHIYLSNQLGVPAGAIGKITGTLSDHPYVPYADVQAVGAQVDDGEKTLGTYVGVSADGKRVALRSVDPKKIDHAVRLSVSGSGAADGEWVFPLAAGTYNYSSPYGPRSLGGDDFHNGADFGTQGVEAPLVAMHSGKVIAATYQGAWGNYLMVETDIPVPGMPGSTYKYMYAHMSRYEFGLTLGANLTAGDPVGNVGNTGNSRGEHLHLNICTSMDCLSGDQVGSIDPIPFLESVGIVPEGVG